MQVCQIVAQVLEKSWCPVVFLCADNIGEVYFPIIFINSITMVLIPSHSCVMADLFRIILTFHILDFVRLLIASLERDTCIAARGYDGLAYQPAQKHQHLEYGRLVRMR